MRTPLGYRDGEGSKAVVAIPSEIRLRHTHIIGSAGVGKSTLLENMALSDIQRGHGVAVLDPRGGLVSRLLRLIPREHAGRAIYFNPGDPDWIPLWNPLASTAGVARSHVADDLIRAFKSFMDGFGDRPEYLLRNAIFAVMHLPGGCLLDVADLLRKKSRRSRDIRAQLRPLLDQYSATFWEEGFDTYGQADLTSAQHKLSKLLGSETVGAMLSRGESALDFRQIMDTGKILLVDLSNIDTDARNVLGCFVLSLLRLTALGRRTGSVEEPRPFHIYCDEAHRFILSFA